MKRKIIPCFTLFAIVLFCACASNNDKKTVTDSLTQKKDTVPDDHVVQSEEDCLFDTSYYKFTTEKLRAFKKDIQFRWNPTEKLATTVFPENDTMELKIGGCYDFGFSAVYYTDASHFTDDTYLLDKAKWLATNFFGNGFDKIFADAITDKRYDLDRSDDTIIINIKSKGTAETNKVTEPIVIESKNGRVRISLLGYEN